MCLFESKASSNEISLQNQPAMKQELESNLVAFKKMFTSSEATELLSLSKPLGPDPYVDSRTKNMMFVMLGTDGRFRKLSQDFVIQPSTYNDNPRLGGNKRQYQLLPDDCVDSKLMLKALHQYVEHFRIEPGTLFFLNIQETRARAAIDCITEQGVHSADHGMIICLERTNVKGAENEFFDDVHGQHPITKPRILEVGDSVFWKDNEVYHNVTPLIPDDPNAGPALRSVLVVLTNASCLATGIPNENNKQTTRSASLKLVG